MTEANSLAISPLGSLGLGTPGAYSSLGMNGMTPYGMNGISGMSPNFMSNPASMMGMGMMGMGAMGMGMGMGMDYSGYIRQMGEAMKTQNAVMADIEKNKLQNAGAMHQIMLQNQVQANNDTDKMLAAKVLTNASVQQGIQNLYDEVKNGQQDGICRQFDNLKAQIYSTYKDELKARGSEETPDAAAARLIESIYAEVVTAQTGQPHNLRDDIMRYGDNSLQNGFMKGFRPGTHEKYVDQTMSHCFGVDVDQAESKDNINKSAVWVGRAADVASKGLIGGALGIAGGAIIKGFSKLLGISKFLPSGGIGWKSMGRLGMVAGLGLGALWQMTSAKSSNTQAA